MNDATELRAKGVWDGGVRQFRLVCFILLHLACVCGMVGAAGVLAGLKWLAVAGLAAWGALNAAFYWWMFKRD